MPPNQRVDPVAGRAGGLPPVQGSADRAHGKGVAGGGLGERTPDKQGEAEFN